MGSVELIGQLVCRNDDEAVVVARHLPLHMTLTRAEVGCLSFDVSPTDDPLVWDVHERFGNPEVFRAHQARGATSEWGRVTAGIERRYTVAGLDAPSD
jgi:quinol monooxygenase YgiN